MKNRTFWYGKGFLCWYVFDKRKYFTNCGISFDSLRAVRATSIREARRKVRLIRLSEG
jgi:hypothetical protein